METADQRTVARALGVSQPAISRLLSQAEVRGVKPLPEGFSGASPYEIAERYAAGDIDREAMIRELSAWPYAKNEGGGSSGRVGVHAIHRHPGLVRGSRPGL